MIRHGQPPYLECSSRGDRRFSAFSARIEARGGRSIEELYQAAKVFADGRTSLTWREAKGRRPVNAEEVAELYSRLWDEYIAEHPGLLAVLRTASGLSDRFGQPGHCCQATELWRIRNAAGCPWCCAPLVVVWVHGHGQCATCRTNVAPCCDGENADPNQEQPISPTPANFRARGRIL